MRLSHIDRIKAIAVLFMVEVHTAAIVPPSGVTVGHPAAFIAASFGGMAAPLFVTISGWGMYGSARRRISGGVGVSEITRWIAPRVLILCICQLMVNLLLNIDRGGRFEWHTPGVLTLLAIGAILSPIIAMLSRNQRVAGLLIFSISPLIIGDYAQPEMGWFERVGSSGASEWFSRLIWNGTYPIFPWIFYILLGTILYDLRSSKGAREMGIIFGLIATSVTIAVSLVEGTAWALTSGEAILTFFPASMPFLIVSGTMVALAMRILEGMEESGGSPFYGDKLAFLEPAGRLSLTIYVAHFAVLGIVAFIMQGEPRLPLIPAFAVTIIHTIIWVPLSVWHERFIPNFSLERMIRVLQSER